MATNEIANDHRAESNQAADSRRERSTISFPYLDLEEAIRVAKGVHSQGGKSCQQEQLAAELDIDMDSSSFRVKINTARIFGLVTYTTDVVYLTDVGLRICDDRQEAAARVDAFLAVPLYKRVYNEYKGAPLPPLTALENAFIGFGVATKQAASARQTFYRSAKRAGFFEADPKRLVLPSVKGRMDSTDSGTATIGNGAGIGDEKPKPDGGGDGGGSIQNPLLRGLIEKLPQPDTEWSGEQRRKWLVLAVNIFDNVYTMADDVVITVSIAKDSAK